MPVFPTCSADSHANDLFDSLTQGMATPPVIDFTDPQYDFSNDPNSPLNSPPTKVELSTLTTCSLEGTGVFDKLMHTVDLHIQREFKNNRITGDEYAKVYTEVMAGVLSTSVQFTLAKDQAYWEAIKAQMEARIAEVRAVEVLVSLETAKAAAAKMVFDMQNSGAQYALTKMNIANADAQYCLIQAQVAKEEFTVNTLLPSQAIMIAEQAETERANTLDTRTDGMAIAGSVGKQKELYTQQIDSFVKDARHKTAKMYLDVWITQKTLDDAIIAPPEFENAAIDAVLASVRADNNLL